MTEDIKTEEKPKRTRRKAAPKIALESAENVSKAVSKAKPFPYRARVATGLLNVREDASRDARIMGTVSNGYVITVTAIVGEFAKLDQGGYVRTDFIEKVEG